MLVKTKPTSPGRRGLIKVVHKTLHKGSPCKALTSPKKRINARNNQGRITISGRGGGHKRHYRIIDLKRDKEEIIGKVERIEYDPNRTAHLALILYTDGERRYIIAPKGIVVGAEILSGIDVPIKPGNCMQLEHIPIGTTIHCVELKPGKGAQMIRSAGTSAQLVAREDNYASIRMPSGEIRRVLSNCRASIGAVSNIENSLRSLGKAGANRWRGKLPKVRGVAKNPVDHPHGGGEGRTSGGRHPVTPHGKPTKGYKTRNNKRTDKAILRDRRDK